MVQLWLLAEALELRRCFIQSAIVDCASAGAGQREIAKVDALQMSQLAVLRQE